MRKIVLFWFLLLFLFSSCNKKVEIPTYSHRDLLGLKGAVKKIRFTFYEYEITGTSYYEVGKTTPSKRALYNFFDYSVQSPYFFSSNSHKLSDVESFVIDPFTISILSLKNKRILYETYDTYEIEFNQKGNIISCSGFLLNNLHFKQEMKYDSQDRLIFVSYKNKYNFNDSFTEKHYKYEYNKSNLIKKRIQGWGNSDEEHISLYEYNFENKNEIQITKIFDSKKRDYKIFINENNLISKLLLDDFLKLTFKDGLCTGFSKYEKGNLSYSEDYDFTNLILNSMSYTERKQLNEKAEFSQFSLFYDYNFNISSVKGILSNGTKAWEDFQFDYILDINGNWTQQSYYRDRKKYDEYKRKIDEMMNTNEYYLENYGVYYYHMAEVMMVSKELESEKKFCSKTVVDRNIIYFD